MKRKDSLPCYQLPADGLYPKTEKISEYPHTILLYDQSISSSHLLPGIPSGLDDKIKEDELSCA
jgi:hypothetical protein